MQRSKFSSQVLICIGTTDAKFVKNRFLPSVIRPITRSPSTLSIHWFNPLSSRPFASFHRAIRLPNEKVAKKLVLDATLCVH
mmetsp:Transcript_5989/g.13159  ORF Transcript_5989/g.13159 Transcript_5989/m.13159 type:complete len:82 (+) Transcript_5989:45-290(+)